MNILIWIIASTSLAISDDSACRIKQGFTLDANFFTDADELTYPALGSSASKFCQRTPFDVARSLINDSKKNTLSFYNPGGLLGKGLCWLHTRFQRAASYLANFRPELPKPSKKQAQQIIEKIAAGDEVVEVPGFHDLNDFSAAYRDEITTQLDKMGVKEFFNLNLTSRFGDTSALSSKAFKSMMDTVYDKLVSHPHLVFLRERADTHSTPFHSHSLLLLKMEPIRDETTPVPAWASPKIGYRLKWIDSNSPDEVVSVEYHYGDTQLSYCLNGKNINPITVKEKHTCRKIAVYLDYEEDLFSIEQAIRKYCKQ